MALQLIIPLTAPLRRIFELFASIPNGRPGLKLCLQFRHALGLFWAAHMPQDNITFTLSMDSGSFHWQLPAGHIPEYVTMQFNIFDIIYFLNHLPELTAFYIEVNFDDALIRLSTMGGLDGRIITHLQSQHQEWVENATFHNLFQEFIVPRPFLTLRLQTYLLRRFIDYSEQIRALHGNHHNPDLPVTFIAWNSMLCICVGDRRILIVKNEENAGNAGRFRVLRIRFNQVPAVHRALQMANSVLISNMPPIMNIQVEVQVGQILSLAIHMPLQSACWPEATLNI